MNDNEAPRRTGLLDFLRNSQGTQFVIPVYQRNYTWTSGKEVAQYLEDIKNVLSGKYKNHFMGIVIYLSKDIDFSTREFSVIDGQQRLTTTFLALYAIRYLFKESGLTDDIQNLDNLFLTNNTSSAKIKYKLKPLISDDDIYQCIIDERLQDISNKTSNVYKNFLYLKEEISKIVENGTSLNTLLMALNQLYVVVVPILKDDNPQKIFESINATGVKLTASDLIRNYILMDLTSEEQDKYYPLYWKKLEELVSTDAKKLELFFRLYLASKEFELPNKNNVYREFVSWSENQKFSKEELLKDVIEYAKAFNYIYKADDKDLSKNLKTVIKEFRRINSDMPAPVLMDFYIKMQKNIITEIQFSTILFTINTYLIRRALCDKDSNVISRLFPNLLAKVLDACKDNYKQIVEYFKRELILQNVGNSYVMPTDSQLRDYIYKENMYNLRATLRIVFDRLEMKNNSAPVDLSALSVEHLMPQTPTDDWLMALNVSEEEYMYNLHRIGNLTLATAPDNSKMKNKIWEYKNEILKSTSHIKMNEKLLQIEQWNTKEIENRTNELIKEICEIYPYPSVSDSVIEKMEIYLESKGHRADAIFNLSNGNVEIAAGSFLGTVENVELYPQVEDLRKELLEEGYISEINGELQFVKPYLCSSLSKAANIVLHGNRNGWEWWKNSEGENLKNIPELVKKMIK